MCVKGRYLFMSANIVKLCVQKSQASNILYARGLAWGIILAMLQLQQMVGGAC